MSGSVSGINVGGGISNFGSGWLGTPTIPDYTFGARPIVPASVNFGLDNVPTMGTEAFLEGLRKLGGGTTGSGSSGFGMNMPTFQLAFQGLNALGNMWTGSQALDLGRKQFNLQSQLANTNLANQIKSYNTRLADRAYSRAAYEGDSRETADQYIAANRLTR